MRFRDLAIGDTFDWINPMARERASYHHRCIKISARQYRGMYDTGHAEPCYRVGEPMTVGTINASVFSVMRADD